MSSKELEIGHLVTPGSPAPGVVMIHDVWGLSDHTRSLAARLAREGFSVLALDLESCELYRAVGDDSQLLLEAATGPSLEYVDQLREIDDETEELTHVIPQALNLRPDEVRESLPRAEVLALAPSADDETMKVPAVIEGGGGA